VVHLLSTDPATAAIRLRLAAFTDVALALADALEAAAEPAALETVTDAVRRAFARLPAPPGGDADAAAAYQVARDIATADCDFVTSVAREHRRTSSPDLVLTGYGRWVREQLDLVRA
jgi:hypothetical protein